METDSGAGINQTGGFWGVEQCTDLIDHCQVPKWIINSTKGTTGFRGVISSLALTRLSFPRPCEEAGTSKEVSLEGGAPLEGGALLEGGAPRKLEGICFTDDLSDAFIQVI